MYDPVFLFFGVAVFVAVVLGLEGGYLWWNDRRGPEAKRIERRLRAASAGGHGQEQISILKQRALAGSEGLQRLLLGVPRVHSLDRLLMQSGLTMTVAELLGLMLAFLVGGWVVSLMLGLGWLLGIAACCVLGMLPLVHALRARARRLVTIDNQLPDAIDLMGRAMRAGHAFPTALGMVGDEMADPIATEFRTLFDELNYGVALSDALMNLLVRVPSTDLRYFVVALLIQRQTGGNLAELLDNISAICRGRIKLMGEVRTLSAEGRLSAWILSLLPFVTGLLINLVNPGFLNVLWTDPFGLRLVYAAVAMIVFGIWWMTRIIKIRV